MILDGKQLSNDLKEEMAKTIEQDVARGLKRPHLAAVLVGDNPASKVYVRNKVRTCNKVGMTSTLVDLPADISEEALLEKVDELNKDKDIDGYIVQLPLPDHIDAEKINLAIDPRKDVDGFHPVNFGRMTLGLPAYLPATPFGILTMMERYKIETEGKRCVIIGRSNIVGMPMGILLSQKRYPGNCTVTIAHSRTKHLDQLLSEADIIVAAIGRPNYVTADQVKEGAVVIDVGINRVEDASRKRGYRLVGDVDFEALKDKCSYITPVPGGVGPMTIMGLMSNTIKAARKEIYA